MTNRAKAPDEFWHKPEADKEYHFYNADGRSLCKQWVLVGIGMPKHYATKRPSRKVVCAKCAKAA